MLNFIEFYDNLTTTLFVYNNKIHYKMTKIHAQLRCTGENKCLITTINSLNIVVLFKMF